MDPMNLKRSYLYPLPMRPSAGWVSGLAFVLLLLVQATSVFCQVEEYTLKAVYLERITRFLKWPDHSEEWADDAFVIGVLGENPFGERLKEILSERTIKNRQTKVRSFSGLTEISQCHLLYISPTASAELSAVLEVTRKRPILTVGDTTGFAEKGVLVNLFVEKDKLRFEINERGFHDAGILIDSLLLKVAKIVDPLKG